MSTLPVTDDTRTAIRSMHLMCAGDLADLEAVCTADAVNRALAHFRCVLGDDHPDTLRSAHDLAIDLAALGEHEQARALAEDTLTRRRHVLGHDHPDTGASLQLVRRLAQQTDESPLRYWLSPSACRRSAGQRGRGGSVTAPSPDPRRVPRER